MHHAMARIYCAGPLFNGKERQEMEELARSLEAAGYDTFLPQRDGLELTKCVEILIGMRYSPEQAAQMMSEAIFALDVFQVLHGCHAVVANLNGRVPDEGTVSEVAMAWARGKVVVGYKSDTRSVFEGQDNPLVTGLFEFKLCRTFDAVVKAVSDGLRSAEGAGDVRATREQEITSQTKLGSEIWRTLQQSRDIARVVEVLVHHKGEALSAR
jgi:nucleoside 2-deoxyribosyltransferase